MSNSMRSSLERSQSDRVRFVDVANEPVVLIVDDEAFARLFAVQILLDLGMVVLEAGDAAEAIEMLQKNADVSVVLTDISMPGAHDGLDLVKHIREARPEISVLVTSGFCPPAVIEGCTRFLPKPYMASTLVEAVSQAVHSRFRVSSNSIDLKMLGGS